MKKIDSSHLNPDGGIVRGLFVGLNKLICLLICFLWGMGGSTYAQHMHADGTMHDDHGVHEPAAETIKVKKVEAVSDRYELVLKYEHLHANEVGKMTLYVADPVTNRPISNAKIVLSASLDSKATFDIKPKEAGIYEVTSRFSRERIFSLTAKIEGINGPDLMILKGVLVGHDESEHAHEEANEQTIDWQIGNWRMWVMFGGGLVIGLIAMFLAMKKNRTLFSILLIGTCFFPTYQPSQAQEDHEHESEQKTRVQQTNGDAFDVPKETQFLFEVLTNPVETGNFRETTQLYGTVIPASTGMAVVQTPQVGRIVSLTTRVGQRVNKGQTLAVVEQTIDASTQVSLQAERNNLEVELATAQKEYERLKKIEDIAAKRDIVEAEARLRKVQENLKVFNNIAKNGKGNSRLVALTAPISGVVAPFAVAIGSTVGTGETLFTITNLSKVYVETQVFEQDADKVRLGTGFEVECQRDSEKHKTSRVRLLSGAQVVNANQSQKMLFEVENPDGDFKIGEYVTVRAQARDENRTLALPNSALSQLNGKPCVFVKESPERFRVEYVAIGNNNGASTTILKGVHSGEKVVVTSSYQLKMIFLNQ